MDFIQRSNQNLENRLISLKKLNLESWKVDNLKKSCKPWIMKKKESLDPSPLEKEFCLFISKGKVDIKCLIYKPLLKHFNSDQEVKVDNDNLKWITLASLGPGELIYDDLFVFELHNNYKIVATENSILYEIPVKIFEKNLKLALKKLYDPYLTVLKKSGILNDFGNSILSKMIKYAKCVRYSKGNFLLKKGDEQKLNLLYLISGKVKYVKEIETITDREKHPGFLKKTKKIYEKISIAKVKNFIVTNYNSKTVEGSVKCYSPVAYVIVFDLRFSLENFNLIKKFRQSAFKIWRQHRKLFKKKNEKKEIKKENQIAKQRMFLDNSEASKIKLKKFFSKQLFQNKPVNKIISENHANLKLINQQFKTPLSKKFF